MTQELKSLHYRPDIDGLRAIAVLSVIAFHADILCFTGGFAGVDIFFVISGYLISTIIFTQLENGTFSFADFYAHRIRRIFPALILVLFVTCAIGWLTLLANPYYSLGKYIIGGTIFVSNFILWEQSGYFNDDNQTNPLLHLWSLGVEEQFYIIWPLLLYLCYKRNISFLWTIGLIMIASFAINVLRIDNHRDEIFYLPQGRFWELMAGAALAYVHTYKMIGFPSINPSLLSFCRNICAWMGIIYILLSIFGLRKTTLYPGVWALLPVMGAFLTIVAGKEAWFNRKVLAHPFMAGIGLISFPLYLWHWPLLAFARYADAAENPGYGVKAACVVCAFYLAWATYQFLEKPVRCGTWLKTSLTLPVLITGMTLVCLVGTGIVMSDGVIERFPEEVRYLANYKYYSNVQEWNCFLNPYDDHTAFNDRCIVRKDKAPLVLLWGDSSAAALYSGLQTLQKTQNFSTAEYTASACPPLINLDLESRSHCKKTNDFVLEKIKELKPETVVLSAIWTSYITKDNHVVGLHKTIQLLKERGVQKIILVGEGPVWDISLYKILYNAYHADPLHVIPQRMQSGFNPSIKYIDRYLKSEAERDGVTYFSVYKTLCDDKGCLTYIGDNKKDLVAFDKHHLTAQASRFVMWSMSSQLPQ